MTPRKGMSFKDIQAKKSMAKEKAMVKSKDAAAGKSKSSIFMPGGKTASNPTAKPAAPVKPGMLMPSGIKEKISKLKSSMSSKPAAKPAAPAMKKGGCVKKYAKGGGIEVRGKTKGKMI